MADALQPAGRRLKADERLFDEEATSPLEELAKAFPLVADQSSFAMLVLREEDLAQRLASLKDATRKTTRR